MSGKQLFFEIPKISLDSGDLSFFESSNHIPFELKRIFYMYNLKNSKDRGKHAHYKLHQMIFPVYGSLNIKITDGKNFSENYYLSKQNIGMHIPPMHWIELNSFKDNSVVLVAASETYDEADYIRDYDTFVNLVKNF